MALSDSELVAGLISDGPSGLRDVYDQYSGRLYGYALTITHNQALAEDAVQDSLLIAMGAIEKLRDPSRFRSWLFAITRNECLRQLRTSQKSAHPDQSERELAQLADDTDLDRGLDQDHAAQVVQAAIAGLSPSDRDIITMALQNDMDPKATGHALGLSPSNLHARLSRARKAMESSVSTVLLIGTRGKKCEQLAAILNGQSRLNPLVRKRVTKHKRECDDCERRSRAAVAGMSSALAAPIVAAVPTGLAEELFGPAGSAATATSTEATNTAGLIAAAQLSPEDGFPAPMLIDAAPVGPPVPGAAGTNASLGPEAVAAGSGALAVLSLGTGSRTVAGVVVGVGLGILVLIGLGTSLVIGGEDDPALQAVPTTPMAPTPAPTDTLPTAEPTESASSRPSSPAVAPTPTPQPQIAGAGNVPGAGSSTVGESGGGNSGGGGGVTPTPSPTTTQEPANKRPKARFSVSTTGLTVDVDASRSKDTDGGSLTYAWDFTGNGKRDAKGVRAAHTYTSAGTHTIELTVRDSDGGRRTRTKTVTLNRAPTATFTTTADGLTVQVNAAGSTDPDGSPLTYAWDFTGNGSVDAQGVIATHTYGAGGSYRISLTITDNLGATGSDQQPVTVSDAPIAAFTYSAGASSTYTFDASGSRDPAGGPLTYAWDFDNNGTTDATGVIASTLITAPGTHPITLTVTNTRSLSSTSTQDITVP